MAMCAKLRGSQMAPEETASADDAPRAAGEEAPEPAPIRRARPRLLLLAGIALLAGGAFLLVQALRAAQTLPARTEPVAQPPSGAKSGVADPTPQPVDQKGAAG
jgi:hypothetical protein